MIPSREEIEKAIQVVQKSEVGEANEIKLLLSLAEAYLAQDEPKEKELIRDIDGAVMGEFNKLLNEGYNQALADSRLWLMKKCKEIEKLISIKINQYFASREHKIGIWEYVAQAIQSHLLGGER